MATATVAIQAAGMIHRRWSFKVVGDDADAAESTESVEVMPLPLVTMALPAMK